jgi:hypothetical protein
VKAWKGGKPVDGGMVCRDKTYIEGESYTEPSAIICKCGMHACTMPMDVLSYYPAESSVYHEVEVDDDATGESDGNSKVVSRHMSVKARLSIPGLIKASVEWVFQQVEASPSKKATTGNSAHSATTGYYAHSATTGYYAHSATTGDYAHSATTGDYAHSATTGNSAHSATTGYYAHSATTGNSAHSATTGYYAHSATTGYSAIAAALGRRSQAKAGMTGWLVLSDYDHSGELREVIAVKVGRRKRGIVVKPDAWYALRDGRLVEVDDDGEAVSR